MGQRSEIYVAYETRDGKKIVARYFGWNYGERMISRITHTAGWLQNKVANDYTVKTRDLISIIETNFDFVDVQESADLVCHNNGMTSVNCFDDGNLNDGRGFLYVGHDGIKYCFTDNHNLIPLDCDGYMLFDTESCYPQYQWINEEYKKSDRMKDCMENIKWLAENATVMTQEELDEFINAKYDV